MPAAIRDELPAGVELDVLLAEIRQGILGADIAKLIKVRPFDVSMPEALAVVRLSDEGFSDNAAWWLAREASVAQIVEMVP